MPGVLDLEVLAGALSMAEPVFDENFLRHLAHNQLLRSRPLALAQDQVLRRQLRPDVLFELLL